LPDIGVLCDPKQDPSVEGPKGRAEAADEAAG
jgi:hypothetical protein